MEAKGENIGEVNSMLVDSQILVSPPHVRQHKATGEAPVIAIIHLLIGPLRLFDDQIVLDGLNPFHAARDLPGLVLGILVIDKSAQLDRTFVGFNADTK